MPTNQQRRDAAKRKLERQLVRRQEQLHSRRQRTIIGSVLAVVLLTAGIIWLVTADRTDSAADGASTAPTFAGLVFVGATTSLTVGSVLAG